MLDAQPIGEYSMEEDKMSCESQSLPIVTQSSSSRSSTITSLLTSPRNIQNNSPGNNINSQYGLHNLNKLSYI